jgi:hypothetical protein
VAHLRHDENTSTQLPNTTTHFCTTKGWFPKSDLTRAVRRAILSAEGGIGAIDSRIRKGTCNELVRMGLARWVLYSVVLTHHGENLWLEIDA